MDHLNSTKKISIFNVLTQTNLTNENIELEKQIVSKIYNYELNFDRSNQELYAKSLEMRK